MCVCVCVCVCKIIEVCSVLYCVDWLIEWCFMYIPHWLFSLYKHSSFLNERERIRARYGSLGVHMNHYLTLIPAHTHACMHAYTQTMPVTDTPDRLHFCCVSMSECHVILSEAFQPATYFTVAQCGRPDQNISNT